MSFFGLFKSQEQKDQEAREERNKRYLADTVGEAQDGYGPGGEEAYKAQVAEQNRIANEPKTGWFSGGKRSRKYRKSRKSRKSRGKRSKRFS
jgi:hypothetical protein